METGRATGDWAQSRNGGPLLLLVDASGRLALLCGLAFLRGLALLRDLALLCSLALLRGLALLVRGLSALFWGFLAALLLILAGHFGLVIIVEADPRSLLLPAGFLVRVWSIGS